MKTDLNQLLFETVENAQKILNVNDPGFTITLEGNRGIIRNPSGIVVAEILSSGADVKELLHG